MKYSSLFIASAVSLIFLSSCTSPFQKTVNMNTTPETPFREITQEELIAFTPSGFQLMPLKGETSNVLHVNVDGDNDEEILMIFNSNEGCTLKTQARLILLDYDHASEKWILADTFFLAGKQGRIESFDNLPQDIIGDQNVDIEIVSETNGCGGPWVLYKQLLTFHDGKISDFTNGNIFSVEGGSSLIQLTDKTYEVYASDGQEGTCKSYTLTQFVFDGQKFVQDHVYTTKYSYKTIFDLSGASHPDSFTEGCIMTDKNTRKLEYIRDDAVNNKYPSVVQS